jgi:hypothetical protein
MIITAFNPDTDDLEKTYISAYVAAGVNSLPVKDNDRFLTTRRVLLGRMGDERSELVTLNSVSVNKIQLGLSANTVFAHNADDPVYLLDYDKVNFYRAASANATPVLMTTVDVDVDNQDNVTRWDDTTSLPAYFYWITYSNSVTLEETDYSDPIQTGGYAEKSAGKIIDIVARRVRDTNFNTLTIDEYLDVMDEVGSDLITQAHRPYRFLRKNIVLDTVADQGYIEFPANLWKFNHVYISTNSGNYNRFDEAEPVTTEYFNNRYDNNQSTPQDNIQDVAVDEENNRLLIWPTPKTSQTGVVKLNYYKTFDPIDDVGSIVETPNNLIYRYKLMAEYYSAKSETDSGWARLAEKYEGKYGNEIVKMQRVNRLDTGTPRSMMPKRAYRRKRYHL